MSSNGRTFREAADIVADGLRLKDNGTVDIYCASEEFRAMAVKWSPSERLLANLDGLLPELETIYKDIHSHPELSMQEERTAGIAADRLRAAGYEVTTGVGKTGVAGLLRNGEGPTVMLRADMDALPVQEATGLPYASKVTATDSGGKSVPVMHACGHDMHVTWLIGAATLFAKAREAWNG